MIIFGPGVIIAKLNSAGVDTPYNVGLAQKISYEEAFTTEALFGQNRRALAIGAGTIKGTGKITAARFSLSLMANLLYGTVPTVGSILTAYAEAHQVPAVSTYTVTVTNSAHFVAAVGLLPDGDLGVSYATGVPLTRVTSVSAAGQYSLNPATGIYTFFSGDASANILISYNYTATAAGYNVPVGNPPIGPTYPFSLNIMVSDPSNSNLGTWQVYNAVLTKFGMATDLTKFAMPEYDYECFANAAGQYGQWNMPDLS